MVIECSNCHARYNVDESKIPVSGVKVRCHKCQNIIVISKKAPVTPSEPEPVIPPTPDIPDPGITPPSESTPAEPPSVPEPDIPEPPKPPSQEPEVTEAPAESAPPEPEVPEPEIPDSAPPESAVAPPQPVAEKPGEVEAAPPAAPLSEEDKKWNERARRLAKALASDLVLYNQEKVEEGLRNGTLADLLGPEIRRSWEYYCQQIPKHIVEMTDHFKEQLNKIVGKGKEIFK